jgi:hypothetical protein
MSRIMPVLLAALGFLAVCPDPGFAAPPPPAAIRSEADALILLKRLAEWAQPSTKLIESSQTLALDMIEMASAAIESDTKGPEGLARARAWEARTTGGLVRLRADAAALQPAPPDILAAIRSIGPTGVRQAEGLSEVKGLAQRLAEDTALQIERMTPLIIKASSGDEQSKTLLAQRTLSGMRLLLQAENTLYDLSIVTAGKQDHPQVELSRAAKFSNQALVEALKYYEARANGGSPSASDTAAAMNENLDQSRKAALAVWPKAQLAAKTLDGVPKGELRTRLDTALASYKESGEIEADLAEIIAGAARALESGKENALDLPGLDALVDRRVALTAMRASLFQAP